MYGFSGNGAFYVLPAQNPLLPNERSAYVKIQKMKAFPSNDGEGFFNIGVKVLNIAHLQAQAVQYYREGAESHGATGNHWA